MPKTEKNEDGKKKDESRYLITEDGTKSAFNLKEEPKEIEEEKEE